MTEEQPHKQYYTTEKVVELVDKAYRERDLSVTYYRLIITHMIEHRWFYEARGRDMYHDIIATVRDWMKKGLDNTRYQPILSGCTFGISDRFACVDGRIRRLKIGFNF